MRRALWSVLYVEALRKKRTPLWSKVGHACGLGSGSATRLCQLLGFDPETGEIVRDVDFARPLEGKE